jgi:ergothioneine biosynthesis protein EgtB
MSCNPDDREAWCERVQDVRARSLRLVEPFTAEDLCAQAMDDASPGKWHLAHTSWFFEEFVLGPAGLAPRDAPAHWNYLFNSYYESLGERHPRPSRGLITRPGLEEVKAWRADVDQRLLTLCRTGSSLRFDALSAVIELGLHHEMQHQELMVTDLLALFAQQPGGPPMYAVPGRPGPLDARATGWTKLDEEIVECGTAAGGFAFDNERPRHRLLRPAARIADRLVTQGEWLSFIEQGGYRDPALWMSEGWAWVQRAGIEAPLYWRRDEHAGWTCLTPAGRQPIDPAAPVCHVSWWEADAFARFAGARLPTEFEWESVAGALPVAGNLLEAGLFRTRAALASEMQYFGDVWEWTRSAYAPYPGFVPLAGAAGEYNGKFMAQQFVLRGGSFATAQEHLRASYRNFFYPAQRWQFTGLRLARD